MKMGLSIRMRRRMALATIGVMSTALSPAVPLQPRQAPTVGAETHIRALAQRLPPGSSMQSDLESGARGDGIHHSWMDAMQKEGVKRAWIVMFTGLNDPPKEWTVSEVAYYSAYDREGSQITDPKWLERIRTSGLADELRKVALDRAPSSLWYKHDLMLIPVDLLDDEWLPSVTYDQAQAQIRSVISRLPPDSDVRRDFDGGDRGDGINYAWMDTLRKEGIQRAEIDVRIEFHEDGRPRDMKVVRLRYYATYDRGTPIQDPERLKRARASGLEEELKDVALQKAKGGNWFETPRPRPDPLVGGATVVLYDDGWIPAQNPLFTTAIIPICVRVRPGAPFSL
jgi:hypothetical protein